MALLNHPTTAPQDGWQYFQRETGSRFEANNSFELVDLVIAHRKWKKLDRTTAEEVLLDIQRQICERMPPGVCQPEPGEVYQPFDDKARHITTESIMSFSKAAFEFIKSGGELVPKALSERRASICRGCQFNRRSPCTVCTPVFAAMDLLIPKDRIEGGLSACGICGCSLRARVIVPSQADSHRYPDYCWVGKDDEILSSLQPPAAE